MFVVQRLIYMMSNGSFSPLSQSFAIFHRPLRTSSDIASTAFCSYNNIKAAAKAPKTPACPAMFSEAALLVCAALADVALPLDVLE